MKRLSKFLALALTLALSATMLLPVTASAATSDETLIFEEVNPGDTITFKASGHYTTLERSAYLVFSEEATKLALAGDLSYSITASLSCGTSRTFERKIDADAASFYYTLSGSPLSFVSDLDGGNYRLNKENYIVPATTYSYSSGNIMIPDREEGAFEYNAVLATIRCHVGTASDLAMNVSITIHDMSDSSSTVTADQLFSDVEKEDYFCESVGFVYENQYMNGVSDTRFAPANPITRGQFVTTLQRIAGEKIEGTHTFTDVKEGSYYEDAVIWATANGIVNGVSDTRFDPNAPITREQMAAILFRYVQHQGITTTVVGDLSLFRDADQVSSYAAEAMTWANETGLILGKKADILDPQGTATRGQTATVLYRFCSTVAD